MKNYPSRWFDICWCSNKTNIKKKTLQKHFSLVTIIVYSKWIQYIFKHSFIFFKKALLEIQHQATFKTVE